jgi:hypothetical protein
MIGAGDIGDCSALADGGIHARDTARMMDTTSADAIFTAGDNAYPLGSSDDFTCYENTWGRFKSKTFPVPGNHEYYQPAPFPTFSTSAPAPEKAASEPATTVSTSETGTSSR